MACKLLLSGVWCSRGKILEFAVNLSDITLNSYFLTEYFNYHSSSSKWHFDTATVGRDKLVFGALPQIASSVAVKYVYNGLRIMQSL